MLKLFVVNDTACTLEPVLCNYSVYQPNSVSNEHYHNIYHLVFILGGACALEKGNGWYRIGRGDLVVIDPGEKHIFHCGVAATRCFVLNFYLVPWQRTAGGGPRSVDELDQTAITTPFGVAFGVPIDGTRVRCDPGRWPEITTACAGLFDAVAPWVREIEQARKEANRVFYAHRCSLFLDSLLGMLDLPGYRYRGGRPRPELTARIIAFLERSHESKPSLGQMAGELGYSVGHLCNHFRAATGGTIGAYAERLRISQACELLGSTTRTITDIALSLGYGSSQHFSRAFRVSKGMSPREFRKRSSAV